jgi:hypothetical protein
LGRQALTTERFRLGRRFGSVLASHDWVIVNVDFQNGVLSAVDDFGYEINIPISTFDDNFFFLSDLPAGITSVSIDCEHNWKHYYGLKEVYEYCTTCDAKRGQND